MQQGTLRLVNCDRGYGLIVPDRDNKDIFVTLNELESVGIRRIFDGQRLNFEIYNSSSGRNKTGNFAII